MVIREVKIENYLCYYDIKTFELSDGLNIILGENGEGKTKFFEAIDWLFNDEYKDLYQLVSAKKLDETGIGEHFFVRVSMTVEHFGSRKIITKSFKATKNGDSDCSTSNLTITGLIRNNLGEQSVVDGKTLLNQVFPFQIRKYSMFKGESDLDIFQYENALLNLINLFSDAKYYDKYCEKGLMLRQRAEKAIEDAARLHQNNERLYSTLQSNIERLSREKNNIKTIINATDDEIRKVEANIQDAEKHVNNAEALEVLNSRIKAIERDIISANARIHENYTNYLFDDKWILVNFQLFNEEFTRKVRNLSIERRAIQSEFDKQKGIVEGIKNAALELSNNAIPLPVNVPSRSYLEEMLHDKICKVCNREAKEGSEAYEFIKKRLERYIESLGVQTDSQTIFKEDYTSRLEHISFVHQGNLSKIKLIRDNIKEHFAFNDDRKRDVKKLENDLEKEKADRSYILGNSSLVEEKLTNVLRNYNSWQRDLKNRNILQNDSQKSLDKIELELQSIREEKENIDRTSVSTFLIKTRDVLRDIEIIFNDTKQQKFDIFISKLQDKSNSFFNIINIDAFTGVIVFKKKMRGESIIVDVELQEDGRLFYRPNQSLLTSMHISILFAISELASEIRQESFPVILDAPTSSFGENKTAQFLNLIFETTGQKILLIKDFIRTDKDSKQLLIKPEFEHIRRNKALWVKLERPFDSTNLKTIDSQVITL